MTMSIDPELQKQYARDGYLHLPQVLHPEALSALASELRGLVKDVNKNTEPMESRSSYKRAFIQVGNLWQQSDVVRDFVFRADLAQMASEIMGVSGVRLYHDQALFKEAGGGATPWHVDQVYWPMDTPQTCTFWIPLQHTPRTMGTLSFAKGSHHYNDGRKMVISDESESYFNNWVKAQGLDVSNDEFDLGDISVHTGWTVHRAGPNKTKANREAMTIIYMTEDARLLQHLTNTQKIDRDAFTPHVQQGGLLNTSLNPLLYTNQ